MDSIENLDMKKVWIASIHWNWAGCEFNEERKNHFCSGFNMGQRLNTEDSDHSNYVIMSALPNTIFIACILLFYKPLSKKVSKYLIHKLLNLYLAKTSILFIVIFQIHNFLDKYVRFDAGVWLIFAILYFLILIIGFYLYLNLNTYDTSSDFYYSYRLKESWEAYQKLGFWKFLPKFSTDNSWVWYNLDTLHLDYMTYCAIPNLAIVVLTLTLLKGCFFTDGIQMEEETSPEKVSLKIHATTVFEIYTSL